MVKVRRAMLLLGLVLLPGVWNCRADAATATLPGGELASSIQPGAGLFGSHEFRSSLRALPQWTRVMVSAREQVEEMSRCDPQQGCSSAALSWQKIIHEAQGQAGLEQLKTVNAFFNRWPYRLDIDVYGQSDYWATPHEFLKLSGDCEDYSITKYFALKRLGVPVDRLRIVMLTDTIRGIGHAVLAVRQGDDTYVLDNVSDLVLSHRKYEHYQPQYSVNEQYRWAHIAPGMMR